jgi:arylsulfatase
LLLPLVTGRAECAPLPNILLIVADDLGYSDLGCYGGEIDTPNINRLAAEGVRFSEFHVNPMCTVTRTSLMTGHTHSQSDSYRRSLPLAKLMRQAGYATSITGKWHQPGTNQS